MQLFGERIVFDIQIWKIILIPLLILLSIYLYRRTYPALSRAKKVLLALTRICAFSLIVLFILNPSIISMKRESREPLVLVLLDISKSMSVQDHSGRSRFEDAFAGLRILTDAIHESSGSHVEIIPFSSELMMPTEADSALAATGEGTDILRAIHEAQKRYRSENVGAVVLLTDGRITRGVVSSQVPVSVPVYAVQFGDTIERADVSIEEVFYDRTVYAGTKEEIRAVVRAIGFAGGGMAVRLVSNGDVIDEVARTVQGRNAAFDAVFEFKPENPGEYKLTIEAVPGRPEERRENNTETIRVTVRKDKLRFLYIDQHADWNTTFLRDLAAGSDRFEMEAISWLPARGHFRMSDRNSWIFPASAKDLESFDLIVFSDDTKILIDRSKANVLEEYVRGGGGLLLLMDENSPAVQRQSMMFIEDLLPVKLTGRPLMLTGEYAVLIADEWNQLAAILAEESDIDLLPPLLAQYRGLEITAGATVPLNMESLGGPQPFVAVTRYGAGVSAIVMGFPLWRWKLAGRQGGTTYDAFLGGLIQYLAEGIDAPPLDLEADRTVYRAGDRISLAVYLQGKRRPDGVRGEVFQRGGEDDVLLRTFLFQPDSGRESVFRTILDPLPPGEYKVVAQELQDSGSGVTSETEFSILPVSVEFLKTASDAAFLRELASSSGGEVLGAGDLPKLPGRLGLQEDELITKEERALRKGPLLFLCIMACFAAEWIMRKAWGLV